jgi:DNA primase
MKSVGMKLPIEVSNADKVFWPEEGYTKLDLIEFYAEIFPDQISGLTWMIEY